MKSAPMVGRAIELAMGAPVVVYVAYSCVRGRIANVFVGQCPGLPVTWDFCFDFVDVLWDSQPYLFLFLAIFYTAPAVLLVLSGARMLGDPPDKRTREQLERDRGLVVRAFHAWLASPWWFSALVIGGFLLLLVLAVVRMS